VQNIPSSTTSNQQPSPRGKKKSAKDERVNSALRYALFMHTGSQESWEKLMAAGASGETISHYLVDEFGDGGGSQTEEGIQFAYAGLPVPRFWLDCSSQYTTAKPTLQEGRLVKRVRELLQIPELKALDDTAANSDASEKAAAQNYDAHEFVPKSDSKTICALCFQGRRGKPHRAWKEAQSGSTIATSGDESGTSTVTDQADADATPSQLTPTIFTKEIEVELSDADYKTKSRQLAFLRVQIEELQAEKKATDEGYKQKIGGLEEQCAELFRSIRKGRDTLELEVFERRDFELKVVEIVRADTNTVVESREMQERELQQKLPSI
jgi:hypothetical protein